MVAFKSNVEELLGPIVDKVKHEGTGMGRIIVYCSHCKDVCEMYKTLEEKLGPQFTSPPGVPHEFPEHRIVDMDCKITHSSVQQFIVSSFTSSPEASPLRMVIVTVAFGIGVNCSGGKQVIDWGPTEDIENYVQETGRAGRDDQPACALLCCTKGLQRFADDEMQEYCDTTGTCRRKMLFSHFDGAITSCVGCLCCDVCMKTCECGMYVDKSSLFVV